MNDLESQRRQQGSDPVALSGLLASLHGSQIEFATAPPRLVNDQLYPEERDYVANAVAKRQAEFGTARLCARQALSRLGLGPCSLVPNADRSPRWPDGIRGSIAHTDDWCAVGVTDAPTIAAIGLDLESDAAFDRKLEAAICTHAELRWVRTFNRSACGWLGPLIFSAKEAFYKCQFAITQTGLNFTDVELAFDLQAGTFAAVRLGQQVPQPARLMRIEGKFLRAQQLHLVVTTAVLSQTGDALT
jgi:4'-phosphopantetheinyl transferase EntD